MEECELCGRVITTTYVVNVEDVELRVCKKCSSSKTLVYIDNNKKQASTNNFQLNTNYEKDELSLLIENYGAKLKKARESKGLSLKELARQINEKESFLSRIESQRTQPDEKLIRKLEKTFNIRLTEND